MLLAVQLNWCAAVHAHQREWITPPTALKTYRGLQRLTCKKETWRNNYPPNILSIFSDSEKKSLQVISPLSCPHSSLTRCSVLQTRPTGDWLVQYKQQIQIWQKKFCTVLIPSVSDSKAASRFRAQGQGYRPQGSALKVLSYTTNASDNIVPY